MINIIKQKIRKTKAQKEWRRRNKNNYTKMDNYFSIDNVFVGRYTYGKLNVHVYTNDQSRLYIGDYCSIANGVIFILHDDHPVSYFSTFPFRNKVLGNRKIESISKGDIVVGDDVWIGTNAIILSGVSIGQGAIIAAGAVVTGNIPAYAIVGGVPAKVIKYRFSEEIIKELLNIDFAAIDKDFVSKHEYLFYKEITSTVDLKMFPQRK